MPKTRKILHLDLDAFFCSVEEQFNPDLRGKPIAVGGQPGERGVVASASYPARKFGLRSAMPMAQALRLCPGLIIVAPRRGAYSQRSRQVMAILRATAPDVEPLSIDEAFLDVTILPSPIEDIARDLQARINKELGLPCSVGGATNKLVAKTANTMGKARQTPGESPNAITIVPAGAESQFMAPLPLRALWGVGPKTADSLAALGLIRAGQLSHWTEGALKRRLGKLGPELWRRAQGIDHRPVLSTGDAKSISKEVTFAQDLSDRRRLELTLRRLSDGIGRQARQAGLTGAIVKLKLRWPDFTTITRQVTLDSPTDRDDEICARATELFDKHWVQDRAVRLLGLALSGFARPNRQIGLWEDPIHSQQSRQALELQTALDNLRDRYGEQTIRRASDLAFQFSDDNRR